MSYNLSEYTKNSKKKSNIKSEGFIDKLKDFMSKDVSLGAKFSDKKKEQFYKQLSLLLKSNVDFEDALHILKDHFKKEKDKKYIEDIRGLVVRGKGLHEAFSEVGIFSHYEVFSVQIGEETKRLNSVLDELHKYYDRKIKMKRQITSVMTYPIFVLIVTFGVLYFMLNNVVPMFGSIFNQFGEDLPDITKKIIYISDNFSTYLKVFFFLLFSFIVVHYYLRSNDKYRNYISRFIMKIPFFGNLVKKIYLARLTQSMSLMLASKTPLIKSLELAEKMVGFYPITSNLKEVREDILKGISLNESLSKFKIYDYRFVSMVKVAEQINTLDDAFVNITDQYNEEIDHSTKMIGVVMEPIIIIIIGSVVGVIMIAMYSPIFNLSKVLG